jgi:hypothetical protein
LASRELCLLKSENDRLCLNELKIRAGLTRVEEPVIGEGFGVVFSGQMEFVQATLKCNTGRGRRGNDGDKEDEDDGEDGEGEDGMTGLGCYGGSYMDDVEGDIMLNGDAPPPTSSPVQLVGRFAGPSSSMPLPPTMHLHHFHLQQQQMSSIAATSIHHSRHDMNDPRIANLLLKNGNGFSQSSNGSNFGFHQQQHQQLPYNPQPEQQQYQQQQQQGFSSPYLLDKLWNDHHSQTQCPLAHHQIRQQVASRSLFTPGYGLDTESHHYPQQQQQYHQPNLSVNDMVWKSANRGMAIKTKVANASVKASSNGDSHFCLHSGAERSQRFRCSPGAGVGRCRAGVGSRCQVVSGGVRSRCQHQVSGVNIRCQVSSIRCQHSTRCQVSSTRCQYQVSGVSGVYRYMSATRCLRCPVTYGND